MRILLAIAWVSACSAVAWAEPGAVLLRNGQVLTGDVTVAKDRYIVQSNGATIRLRSEDVAVVAGKLAEIYEHQRARRDASRAADCLALAQWCLRNDLLAEAEAELASARRCEPTHPGLARVEAQIEARREALARRSEPAASVAAAPQRPGDLDRLARSLRGDAVEEFSAHIQPMLLNHCATAGCHAPKTTPGFRLVTGSSSRPSRRLTLRNLQSVIEQIDRHRPEQSPLLQQALTAHGHMASPVFTDPDSITYKRLANWIHGLSAPAIGRSQPPAEAPGHLLGQTMGPPAALGVVPAAATAPVAEDAPTPTQFPEGDPFDPAEFNEAPKR